MSNILDHCLGDTGVEGKVKSASEDEVRKALAFLVATEKSKNTAITIGRAQVIENAKPLSDKKLANMMEFIK